VHDGVRRIVCRNRRGKGLAVCARSAPATAPTPLPGARRAGLVVLLAGVAAIGLIRLPRAIVCSSRDGAVRGLATGLTAAAAATPAAPAAGALSAILATALAVFGVAFAVRARAGREGGRGLRAWWLVRLRCTRDRDFRCLEDDQRWVERRRCWRGRRRGRGERLALARLGLARLGLAGLAPGGHVPRCMMILRWLILRYLILRCPGFGRCAVCRTRLGRCGLCCPAAAGAAAAGRRPVTGIPSGRRACAGFAGGGLVSASRAGARSASAGVPCGARSTYNLNRAKTG
jgi:hypothetical protein